MPVPAWGLAPANLMPVPQAPRSQSPQGQAPRHAAGACPHGDRHRAHPPM
ncbi:hypothetical protein AZ22_1111 [Bordetella bronchiseptica 980-2]|nr:hypothetical protein AZ22_1111 [Bordetella bronchiseptica 980-2]